VAKQPSHRRHSAAQSQPSGAGSALTPEIIAERLLDFLKRRGLIALTLALLAGVLAAGVALYRIPLVYTARRDVNLSPPDENRLAEFKQTQIEKLLSPVVCKIAVSLPKARELPFVQNSQDPAEALSRWVEVDSDPLSQSFSVILSDADPQVAQTLVNAVVEAYLQHAQDERQRDIEGDMKLAETERVETMEDIKRIKDQQAELARQAGHEDPVTLRNQLVELRRNLEDKEKEKYRIHFAKLEAEGDLQSLRERGDELTPEQELSLNVGGGDQQLEKALAAMETQAEELREQSIHGDLDADYIRMRNFIDAQRRASSRGDKGDLRARFIAANQAKRQRDISAQETKIAGLAEQERSVGLQIQDLSSKISRLSAVAQKIDQSATELDSKEENLVGASNRLAAFKRSSKQTNVSSPTEADLPKLPKSSSKRLLAIFGGAVGAALGVLALFAYADLQINIVSRPEHLEKTQKLPVLGVLPQLPEGRRIPTDDDFLPDAKQRTTWLAMNEAINSLRITLTFAPDRHDNKGMSTLMVTSPRDAEGKSTFAAHLAISMARTGVKVVLVEADTHRPTQCETFGVERVPGFSDVLQRRVSLSEVIRDTDYPSLFLLPAGSTGDDRTPTLLPDRIAEVFDELRAQFQTIIVDAPPVLPVYDSMVFGQEVDETVLLVRCDHSRFQTIDQARARLESVGIPVAGLVACGSKSANRYGYYYDTYATARGKASSSNGHAAANGHASSNGSAKPKKQTESPQES
jgi:capsular exopolysaccharide synthesis family protein